MPLRSKFLTLLQRSGMAYADLAKRSGVSSATISRIVNGSSGSAENLEALIEALTEFDDEAPSVSHCDMCRAATQRVFDQRFEDQRNHYEERITLIKEHHKERIQERDKIIAEKDAEIARQHKRNRAYMIVLIMLVTAVVILSIIDFAHGGIGWLRYYVGGSRHGVIQQIIKFLSAGIM